jgi:PEP-CTERM motif
MTHSRSLTNVKKSLLMTLAVASLAILPTTAQAVPIAGDLTIAGIVRVTQTDIDWVTGPNGNEFIVLPDINSDYFDDLALTFGNALDLNLFAQPPGPAGFPPLANFLTFDADPGLSFTLTGIASCDPATCFTPGGPFNVFQTFNNATGVFDTTVQMSVGGTVSDVTGPNGTGEVSNFIGAYTATFTGQSIADLIADFNADGQINAGYDAEFVVSIPSQIPEPATLLTFGAGTALMAAHRRRKAKKAAKA